MSTDIGATWEFLEMLQHDKEILIKLNEDWEHENDDPKFDKFYENFMNKFFDEHINPSGKLVLFSESVDTLKYLYKRLHFLAKYIQLYPLH